MEADAIPDPRVTLKRDLGEVSTLAAMFGRSFVHEPMMWWPLGSGGDLAARFARCFAYFLEMALPLGVVWVAGQANGVAVWTAPEQREAWELHPWDQSRILAVAEDGGHRYKAFWEWVARHDPPEPSWQLDTIAVGPELQGRGIGRALIEAGLTRAAADGTSAFLSTGTRTNVAIYRRCGFHVYHEADAPDGGPHVWFMRWNP